MIVLDRITKAYDKKEIVKDFSLQVNEGELCVLIGPSGCGKTTTLRMINRMVEPVSGNIFINGVDIRSIEPVKLRRSMGYAIQMVGLFPHMDVFSNIATVPELLGWEKKRIKTRVGELLQLVGLNPENYCSKFPHQLSGGEAQRVGVARALAADPSILLMDEPFGAVDPLNRIRLQTQFLNIQKKLHKTIILVTHDLDEAIRLGDRIAIMNEGKLVQYGCPEEILARPANKFVYDFVGSDRALKRLSRIDIGSHMQKAPSIGIGTEKANALKISKKYSWVWVKDENNRLKGWIDVDVLPRVGSLREAVSEIDAADISVTRQSSLKEALSIMLGHGLKRIPVIDENQCLLGEVGMDAIEKIMAETQK